MTSLGQIEKDELVSEILEQLSKTQYACSSLTELSGGSVNFMYRGTLAEPLLLEGRGGTTRETTTVIVKHSKHFLYVARSFLIEESRSLVEELMLNALEKFTPGTALSVEIRTPRLYLRNSETNTQLIEDFADTIDLKWIIAGPLANSILARPVAASIGREIGAWLRSFYTWAALPEQTDLLAQVAAIEPMRKMKYEVTYGSFIKILEDFPDLLQGHREALEAVVASTKKDFERPVTDGDGQHWGLIHGDCWTGNILVPNTLWRDAQSPRKVEEIFIIDWEYAQFGHRAYDLGNMVGDLYERKHFHGADGAMWAIEGLVEGYGGLDDELAFRTAIHAGVHLIYWYRRGPAPLERAPREKILGAMTAGRDFILKGWARDREWFEASPLRPLFAKK